MGIIAVFSSLWVFVLISSTADARVINKRAAFYIANDTMCIVDGELYFNGDPVPTDDHCEKCTCRPPGFSCVLRDCEVKPGCKAVRKDGECCPDYICGCSHNGNVYKDGDFIRDLQNPCYTCRCHGSSISCTFADCLFRSDCGPEYIQGECCPRYDHCPPLSTTQKSTTVITTVPITYDETTKPLFNLTSPPHERLATHTTIFPTTGTITAGAGEIHTTETYVKTAFNILSSDAEQTTHIHDSTVKPSSESSTSRTIHADTSTVTAFDLKKVTETSLEFDKDGTQKPESLDEETASTESFSTDPTHWATDVKTDPEAKDFITTHITTELSSERETFTEELRDGQTTEVTHDRQTDVSFTEVSHDEPVTGVPHDDEEDESETELPSGSQTAELVTEVPYDRQTHESLEELSDDSKADHTSHESDETVSVPFSDETSKSTFDVTKEDETEDTTTSVEDVPETTTHVPATHEELKVSPEDEVHSSHEVFSPHPELAGGSEGTSPSSVSAVTMSGDGETEISSVKVFTTTTETRDITSPDTHVDTTVSDTSTTAAQDITTEGIDEDIVEGSTAHSAVTSHDDPQSESELENKTTISDPEPSDFGDREFSTIQSDTESHSFSTQTLNDDDHDSAEELHSDEDEISIQDAEELNLFFGTVTPSGESHLPSGEVTLTQTVTNELSEEESVDAAEVIEDHLQTEQIATDSIVDHTGSDSHSRVQGTTTTHSTEVPDPTQHTQFVLHSGETTTSESVYSTSSNLQGETTTSENNEDTEKFLSSPVTDIPESDSDISQHTTQHLLDEVHPLSEVVEEANVEEQGTVHEDHEVPHLLSEGVNGLLPTDELNTEGEPIHTGTEGSSQSYLTVTMEGTTEAVVTMEAESDLSLTTSENTSTMSSDEDVSITSSRATEHYEEVSESISTTHAAETPVTLTSSPETSPSVVHEGSSEHVTEDDLSTKATEHGLLSEKFHGTETVPSEQDTSDLKKNSDIALCTTEISLDDLDHSDQHTEDHSIISEADEIEASESSNSVISDDISESTVTASSPEYSNDGGKNDVSSTTSSEEIGSTSSKQIMDEPMPTDAHDEYAATSTVFTSDSFIKAEEPDTQKNTLVNELTTGSQRNAGSQTTENTSEITMDAEESIVNNGFESITDYLYTTENDERSYVSTTQDHASVSKEDSETQSHYTIDGETYSAPNGEHIRTSRSTSNSMASSITVEYPEKTEFKTGHTSETERENTGAPATTTGISVSAFDNTVVITDENKPVTESFYGGKSSSSVQENTLESTHSTYLNSEEVSSLSSELSNENLPTTPNTDDSYNSQVTKLITYEAGSPNGADIELNVHEAEETSEDEPEEVSVASTVEILPSVEPTLDFLKNNIAADLIIPVEHASPFNSVETENPTLSDHSTDVTNEHVTNPSTPKITSSAPDLDSAETENEDSSESYNTNHAFETENDEGDVSRFSPTSERYVTDEVNAENDFPVSTTENLQTVSIYTLEAEAETAYFDDSTENSKEHIEDLSVNNLQWNIQTSSEETSHFERENGQTSSDSEDDELIRKKFQNGPEKGGEWFEPTVPVLSVINVHKVKDTTGTSSDIQTNVQYTDVKETTALENEETSSFVTEMLDQTQKSTDIDNTHSSTSGEEQHTKLTTASSDIQYFTKDIAKEEAEMKSEAPSSFGSYETTRLEAVDDLERNTGTHQFFYTSVPDVDLNTNVPTTDETHENDAEATLSIKITLIGNEENGSSSESSTGASSSELEDFYDKEVEEGKFTRQTTTDGVTHENAIKPDPSDESIQTRTTSTTDFISQRDEIESSTTSKVEDKDAAENVESREQQGAEEESQHEVQNLGSRTTRESGMFLSVKENMTHFTVAITDGTDFVTDHVGTTEHGTEHEEPGKSLENDGSEDKFHTNPEEVTNDEDFYVKDSSEESTTAKVNSNESMESKQSEEMTTEGKQPTEGNTENCVSFTDHTEGPSPKNDHDYSTELSSSFYKSTTPLPLLLFNEFVGKAKEDNLVNRNSPSVEEHHNTAQLEEIIKELESGEKLTEDLEKQLDSSDHQISEDKISTTTRKSSNEYDADPTTPTSGYEAKETEIYSTSPHPEELSSQNSYSTENTHFDYSPDESEEVTDSSSSQVTQQNNKSEKNVSRVFIIRRSHDDDPLNEESPQKNEEHTVVKDVVSYSVKSPEIDVIGEVTVTTEEVISQDKGSTDVTHEKDVSASDSYASQTSRSSVESTSTVDTIGFSSNERLNSEFTEGAQNSEDEQVEDVHDDVSGLKTMPDSVNSDTA